MTPSADAPRVTYRRGRGAAHHEVLVDGRPIGSVAPFHAAAGQFGGSWVATTPDGRRSGTLRTRKAAAAWLVDRTRDAGQA